MQFGYLLLFAALVLLPNLRSAPSLVVIAATLLTAVWLCGCLARFAGLPRADELLLAGCTAPLVIGLLQWVYRVDFVRTHGGLADPAIPGSSSLAFALAWAVETLAILLPGAWFLWRNARSLTPAPPPQEWPSRPASRKRRT